MADSARSGSDRDYLQQSSLILYLTGTTEIPAHGSLHWGVEDDLILRCVDKSVSDSL